MVCTAPSLCCPGSWGSLRTWGLGRAFLGSDVNPALSSFPESGRSAGPEPPAPAHPEACRAGEAPRPLPGQGRLCPGQGAAATAEGNWGWASSRPGSGGARKSVSGCAPVDARRVSWWPRELGAGGVAAGAPVPSPAWGLARAQDRYQKSGAKWNLSHPPTASSVISRAVLGVKGAALACV